ncbi:UDP-glucose--hexose-1-phosphate uridylyltransferase [Cetobacterium somerae]|uniref:UDP-glucose--hexose-1-phosphate uridylyltransferase n=1 Tax=Cetobacterium sp. NK01 TaxID=2993530 RepID=UPI002116E06C|nr:UDP-glucose--hexose-1-phosphate uridylyltransferase [Cetobacterium sp. NK01]MCQ8212875.1 UDP-glucose--hexose-1-phosphate uridylyltransferase [Cetobacterium sp. NK01]
MIFSLIQEVLNYALNKNLIDSSEEIYSRNLILDVLNIDDWKIEKVKGERDIELILLDICKWAIINNLINDSPAEMELLDTKIMNCVTPRPKEVIRQFNDDFKVSPEIATANYYDFSKNTNYIREARIKRNLHWFSKTSYGDLEITINLAKPEKDPKDIEREKNMPKSSYPSCLLCLENVGYRGRLNHPARETHRVIPLNLKSENWYFQFSPYVYYNEHSIVFCEEHRPMKMGKDTFDRLLEFIELFPHYCIGSNADLPIVGGSILSHDHYQAGKHTFPMEKAPIENYFSMKNFPNINCGTIKWPMSVIRISSKNKEELSKAAEYIFEKWKNYTDESVDILAYSKNNPHNTVTPIARKVNNEFQIDLALRNNRTSLEHPMGIFHPHSEVHNIKKENIGLIEVMGLAILPGRLQEEMFLLEKELRNSNWESSLKENSILNKHYNWIKNIVSKNHGEITVDILKEEIGKTFSKVLEHAGVFKRDDIGKKAFQKFTNTL